MLAVVPILIGPLQALLAILGPLLLALLGLVLALFKPSTFKKGFKLLWRQKGVLIPLAAVLYGGWWSLQSSPPEVNSVRPPENPNPASSAEPKGWPMDRGGPARLGSIPGSPLPMDGGIQWAFTREAVTFYASPAIVGNRVYIVSAEKGVFNDEGVIYCLDADSGALVWKQAPEDFRATFSSPAVSGKYLICGEGLHFTRDARVICLDVTDGKILWEFRTNSHVESSPCIADGKVYVGAGDDGFYCLSLEPVEAGKTKVIWHVPGENYPDAESSPVVVEGKVYVGLGMGGRALCCLDAETGKELWRLKAPYPVFSSPTVSDGKVFFGLGNGNYVESAELVRSRELQKMADQGKSKDEITEANKRLRPAGEVWCADAETGEFLWRFEAGRNVLGSVAAGKGRVYFGSRDGKLYALTSEGKLAAQRDFRSAIVTSPALAGEVVYTVTESGKLYGVRADDLKPVWETTLGKEGPFLSSPVVARGHVYAGTSRNGLICAGVPGDPDEPKIWAGHLGGPGAGGNIDGSSIPPKGEIAWIYEIPKTVNSVYISAPPAVVGNRLYFPLETDSFSGLFCHAHDAGALETPRLFWAKTQLAVESSPAATDRFVFFVQSSFGMNLNTRIDKRHLHCVDAHNGNWLWTTEIAPESNGKLLLTANYLFTEDKNRALAAFQHSGEVAWRSKIGPLAGPPDAANSILVSAVSDPPSLMALDAATGKKLWRIELDGAPTTGPVVRDGAIYFGDSRGMNARSLIDGKLIWKLDSGGTSSAITLREDWIVYTSADSEVIILNRSDGTKLVSLPDALPSIPPLVSNGATLFATGKAIMRHDLKTGKTVQWLDTSETGPVASPLILSDSIVYFGTKTKPIVAARGVRE